MQSEKRSRPVPPFSPTPRAKIARVEAAAEESALDSIAARNPGIDIEDVRKRRAAAHAALDAGSQVQGEK